MLCNKGIKVNLYKLYFLSSYFSHQPNKRVLSQKKNKNKNKRVFHPFYFSIQPIMHTHKKKLNFFILQPIFYSLTLPFL